VRGSTRSTLLGVVARNAADPDGFTVARSYDLRMDPQAELDRVIAKYPRTPWWGYVLWVVALGAVITWSILNDRSWAFSLGILLGFFGTEFRNYRIRQNARRFAAEAQSN
jgi:hypothetical protein